MIRREFLKTLAVGSGAGLIRTQRSPLLPAADAAVTLRPKAADSVINPHIYGHFIEHLGGVIYDGVWVGRDSKIPNVDGIRKQFVNDMKRIAPPNMR